MPDSIFPSLCGGMGSENGGRGGRGPQQPERRVTLRSMLADFHMWAYGERYGDGMTNDPSLRIGLHQQENTELIEPLEELPHASDLDQLIDAITHVAHELADNVYAAYGSAHSLGIPLDTIVAMVHVSNLTREGGQNRPCKPVKGANYVDPEPAIHALMRELVAYHYNSRQEETQQ